MSVPRLGLKRPFFTTRLYLGDDTQSEQYVLENYVEYRDR